MDQYRNLSIYDHHIFHLIAKSILTKASKSPAFSQQIFYKSPFQMEMLEESKMS